MITNIDVSRQINYKGQTIIFYLEIEYDDIDVNLHDDTVGEFNVILEKDIYSTYENGKLLTHKMTIEILNAINDFIENEYFIQDILQYEYDNREPNFEMP